ncbi:MAG: hypothetical protein ABWK53_10465 [Anaerolineales bacterium]
MGEKATIFQTVQIGIEAVPGTPVDANKKLLATSLVPSVKTEGETFRAMGNKYPSFAVLNKEWSEVSIEGKLTYNEILYLFSSLLSQPTPVQQGGTSAYKWTFASNTSAEDAGKTLTVEQGDVNTAWRAAGVKVSGLEFTFNRNEVSLSGSAIGQQLETGITLTASPTSMTPKPVLPAHLSFYMADTQAGLDSAQALTRGFSLSWSLTDKNALAWPVGQPPVLIESEPKLEANLSLATDTVGLGLIATMRAGTTKWFRVKAEGDTIESTYKYTFQIDFPAQISEVGDFSDEDGIYLVEYTLAMIHDATWGKAFQVDVITDVQTL